METNSEKYLQNEMQRLKKELKSLQSEYGKLDAKRRELAGHLDAAEGLNARSATFIQRAVPVLLQVAGSGSHGQLQEPLNRIATLLKRHAPLDELETAFQQFKEASFRTEVKKEEQKASPAKPSALFGLFKRQAQSDQPDPVSHFRIVYTDIIEELRLNLDQTALGELSAIESRIPGMLQMEDFLPIRQKLLAILKEYISRIGSDRKQAETFIMEVGNRLLEVEQQMLRSITATQEGREASALLKDTIDREMDVIQESVDLSASLDELKSRIMDRISTIKKAIENSRQEDSTRNANADREVVALKQSLDLMKSEIRSAREHSQTLKAELLTDSLTKAFNRRAYGQRFAEELERFHRYRTIFSMLLLDVDHFKEINDRYGHSVGDLCLKEIINRIKPLLRKPDFLCRFGGEEFIIILPGTVRDDARKVAEKIRKHIEKTEFLHKGENVKVTISLGGTQVKPSDKTEDVVFERVDKAMYRAKQSGRNQVVMM